MKETLTSIKKTFKIINCFTEKESTLSLLELYKKTNISKPSILRLCNTLLEENFLTKDPDLGKYRLGEKVLELWQIYNINSYFIKDIERYLKKISDFTGETVTIYKLENLERKCIMRIESKQSLKYTISIGQKLPLHLGAGGKVILAFLSEELQRQYFERLKFKTTYKDLDDYIKSLSKIKMENYYISYGERDSFVAAASVPLFADNNIFGSLSISGPKERFIKFFSEKRLSLLIEYGQKVSKLIKFL